MKLVRTGITRNVLLVGRWAVKTPRVPITPYGFRHFLLGLLANMQEARWWRVTQDPRLCPVVLSVPGGWLNVMRRAETAADPVDYSRFEGLPIERKPESFGLLDGRAVLLDYGS